MPNKIRNDVNVYKLKYEAKQRELKKMKKKNFLPLISAVIVAVAAIIYFSFPKEDVHDEKPIATEVLANEEGTVVLETLGLTSRAKYFSHNYEGTNMEFFALKDANGAIRVAFNSCQVCYNSGKGYFIQNGNNMICQNCGNVYAITLIAKEKGGCNPAPITIEYDKREIEIDSSIFAENEYLFNW